MKLHAEGLMRKAFMPESQVYLFHCLQNKKGAKDNQTGMNTPFKIGMSPCSFY